MCRFLLKSPVSSVLAFEKKGACFLFCLLFFCQSAKAFLTTAEQRVWPCRKPCLHQQLLLHTWYNSCYCITRTCAHAHNRFHVSHARAHFFRVICSKLFCNAKFGDKTHETSAPPTTISITLNMI